MSTFINIIIFVRGIIFFNIFYLLNLIDIKKLLFKMINKVNKIFININKIIFNINSNNSNKTCTNIFNKSNNLYMSNKNLLCFCIDKTL